MKRGKQSFQDPVIQAIVAHVYIAMIHPFGDGNGRTARLIEFYILLRAGLPDMASHILSNHYNDTRQEYYRRLDQMRPGEGAVRICPICHPRISRRAEGCSGYRSGKPSGNVMAYIHL